MKDIGKRNNMEKWNEYKITNTLLLKLMAEELFVNNKIYHTKCKNMEDDAFQSAIFAL
jgi:hypothetical protein